MAKTPAARRDPRQALAIYERHLAIARQAGDARAEAVTLWHASQALAALGERPRAIAYAQAALALAAWLQAEEIELVKGHLARWRAAENDS